MISCPNAPRRPENQFAPPPKLSTPVVKHDRAKRQVSRGIDLCRSRQPTPCTFGGGPCRQQFVRSIESGLFRRHLLAAGRRFGTSIQQCLQVALLPVLPGGWISSRSRFGESTTDGLGARSFSEFTIHCLPRTLGQTLRQRRQLGFLALQQTQPCAHGFAHILVSPRGHQTGDNIFLMFSQNDISGGHAALRLFAGDIRRGIDLVQHVSELRHPRNAGRCA